MKLLSRYVVREHVGPLFFALAALTSLLMLQYVARQLANLAGKGLPWRAIAEFFVLSLPFTIAMTLPMAVLVATLYAFGRMAAEHEITAFKASGVRVRSLMAPVLFCALLLSLSMVWFNDRVLPAANHRLRILQQDIARTRPTLALRDQVLNQVTETFFMRVARSDATTNRMWDVVIYDMTQAPARKTIYADSGVFTSTGDGMQLKLFDGYVQELGRTDVRQLQRTHFRTQFIRVANSSRGFQQSGSSDAYKGDREMSICEMQRKYVASAMEYDRLRLEVVSRQATTPTADGRKAVPPVKRPRRVGLADFYCNTLPGLVGVKTAQAQQPGQPPVTQDSTVRIPPGSPASVTQVPQAAQAAAQPAAQPAVPQPAPPVAQPVPVPQPVPQPAPPPPGPAPASGLSGFGNVGLVAGLQLGDAREALDSLNVEIQKKFALSFACLVFVLFGPPIALRFPRGGVGVTLGVSIVVFGLYYICLMGGEALADKGRLEPSVAMWIANVVFALIGITLLWRVESTTDTSRGGGLRDWWVDRKAARRLRRQGARSVSPAAASGATS